MKVIGQWSLVICMAAALCGCPAMNEYARNYERTYTAAYDADNKSGTLSVTIKPATPTAGFSPVQTLDDKLKAQLEKAVEDAIRRNRSDPDLTLPVEVVPK